MNSHRGLSAIVGTVFLVAIVIGALSYVTYSMNILSDFSESLITEEKRQNDKQSEALEITSVEITPANKLDGVITNTGQIPLNVKTLWIEETGTPDSVKKFDVGEVIAPGNQVNLLDVVDYDIDPTKGYTMKMISDRGTIKTFYINSVGSQSLFLTSRTVPPTISNAFDTTILLNVINNSTNASPILNLTPTPLPVVNDSNCTPDCIATYVSGPSPPYYPRLNPGETATFSWIYTVEGVDSNLISFTTSLQNGVSSNNATSTVEIRDILSALESGTAITSQGLQSNSITSDVLIFHQETDRTPATSYQMFSASPDGGNNGQKIDLDTTTPNFFTQNGTNIINIPAGNWVTSLRLQSEALPTSLKNEGEDMIFHFNTNTAIQDNSEGTASADLEGCGVTALAPIPIITSTDDAEQTNPSGTATTDSDDLEMPYDGSTNQYVGMRFQNVQIPKNAIVTKAYLTFMADSTDSSNITLKINAQATDDATTFSATSNNLSPSTRPRTTASVNWTPSSWSNNVAYSTSDTLLNPVIQEIVNRAGWVSGNDINIFIERVSASSSEKRRSDSFDHGSGIPTLTLEYSMSGAGSPSYLSTGGPHGSGAYSFNGVNQCFRSVNNVSSSDGNNLFTAPHTTALWFKTNAAVGATEQHIVSWDGNGVCPSCDYSRIYLEGTTGKLVFQFNMDLGVSDTSTCKTVSRYDDLQWYHVVAVRKSNNDDCGLYVTNLAGTTLESINSSYNWGTSQVDTDGKWYVGSNAQEATNFFNGVIDDIIHWNAKALSSSPEASDLARTNYGNKTQQLNLEIYETDKNGNNLSSIVSSIVNIPFYDPLGQGDNVDSAYYVQNNTFALGAITIDSNNRLNFTISYIPSTSTWKPLELDMKIDDEDMNPLTSFIQIPPPDTPFLSYWLYDKSNRLEVNIFNLGPQGSWFVYQGTRAVFDSPIQGQSSYAAVICSVNSTESDPCDTGGNNSPWRVMEDRDSIYIPVNATARVYFWTAQDRPDRDLSGGTVIPAGEYDMYVFIDGYDEKGAKFLRNLEMGRVKVQD